MSRSFSPLLAGKSCFLVTTLGLLASGPSWADEPPAPYAPDEPAVEAPPIQAPPVTVKAPVDKAEPVADVTIVPAPGFEPWRPSWPARAQLQWRGRSEIDVGFARYSFDTPNFKQEDFYDFRGRFVLGPTLLYDFGDRHFLLATGQFVAWLREQEGIYQINADDIFVQVGREGLWDLKVGRFMTWTIYRKGLGYDLYTLEDTGAMEKPPFESGLFGVHTYEVNTIYYRSTASRAALHFYPTEGVGIELAGAYGKESLSNTLGGRGAVNFTRNIISVSAGGEYWLMKPASEQSSYDAAGVKTVCGRCGITARYGFGGGVVVKPFDYIEVAANAAQSKQVSYSIKEGSEDSAAGYTTTSFGGYGELDVGKLGWNRSFIVGFGPNLTTRKFGDDGKHYHRQLAGYVALPLGFNDAMWKLIVSNSDAVVDPPTATRYTGRMFSVRTRVSFGF
jgi:hypothetical protein